MTKAKGSPPPPATNETHKITVSKQEQYLTLQAGETQTVDLTCPNGIASDGTVQVVDVDQGEGTPADVEILQANSIAPDTYRFVIKNNTTGQAQVRPHVTCLPQKTDDGQHPIEVGSLQSDDDGLARRGPPRLHDPGRRPAPRRRAGHRGALRRARLVAASRSPAAGSSRSTSPTRPTSG